jgi:SAM-dependent methyltransferase
MPSVANAIAAGSTAAAVLVHGAVAERYGIDMHGPSPTTEPTGPTEPTDPADLEAFWEAHYGKADQVWSGNPNAVLVDEVEGLTPGRALDLGCGEGADAIWLAQQGWQVTGVDVSSTALERAAAEAARRGVADRIEWERHDLATSFPAGTFDLVSAFFFHSPVEIPREQVLRTAAAAVRPGGTLLIVGHAERPSWAPPIDGPEVRLPSAEQVLADLQLDADEWEDQRLDDPERALTAPDGSAATIRDSVLRLRRRLSN